MPFVSIKLLISQKAVYHKPEHDLELIFFVFIYLCTNLSGPKVAHTVSELREFKSLPMASWFNPAVSLQRLGSDKMSTIMLFNLCILPYFTKYFLNPAPSSCAKPFTPHLHHCSSLQAFLMIKSSIFSTMPWKLCLKKDLLPQAHQIWPLIQPIRLAMRAGSVTLAYMTTHSISTD